ncbi:unnamed protein product [Prorocentrum cordatum]|uniref:Uncharacterized protein n=1 Tax=Prorocentrum cordatum TaxID=2364126 RepID=A0ABN9WLW8_9DINO|nr:unnamed protein product [Polarella glacialis]
MVLAEGNMHTSERCQARGRGDLTRRFAPAAVAARAVEGRAPARDGRRAAGLQVSAPVDRPLHQRACGAAGPGPFERVVTQTGGREEEEEEENERGGDVDAPGLGRASAVAPKRGGQGDVTRSVNLPRYDDLEEPPEEPLGKRKPGRQLRTPSPQEPFPS